MHCIWSVTILILYFSSRLAGKLLNVRDATHAQIMKNEEIMNLVSDSSLNALVRI